MPINVKIMPKLNSRSAGPKNRLVVAVVYDGFGTFEFGVVTEVFGLPRPELGPSWYRFAVCAAEPGALRATGGVTMLADNGLEILKEAGTIIIPGWRGAAEPVPAPLLKALRNAHTRGARLVSICTGAFVLAAAGVLAGKRATTHWRQTDALVAAYPDIKIEPDVLYVDEGNVLTSAGSAAGIDLCLHIVRRDFGPETANHVARRLVVPPHRDGGQAQFIERPVPIEREGVRLGPLLDYMRSHLHENLSIEHVAAKARMGSRTFQRRFVAATGATPGEWLLSERLLRARELLESTSHPIEDVATTCGFGSVATLRHHFRSRLNVSPAAYRARFRGQ